MFTTMAIRAGAFSENKGEVPPSLVLPASAAAAPARAPEKNVAHYNNNQFQPPKHPLPPLAESHRFALPAAAAVETSFFQPRRMTTDNAVNNEEEEGQWKGGGGEECGGNKLTLPRYFPAQLYSIFSFVSQPTQNTDTEGVVTEEAKEEEEKGKAAQHSGRKSGSGRRKKLKTSMTAHVFGHELPAAMLVPPLSPFVDAILYEPPVPSDGGGNVKDAEKQLDMHDTYCGGVGLQRRQLFSPLCPISRMSGPPLTGMHGGEQIKNAWAVSKASPLSKIEADSDFVSDSEWDSSTAASKPSSSSRLVSAAV